VGGLRHHPLQCAASAQTGAPVFALDRASVTSVQEYVPSGAVPMQWTLPSNLAASQTYRPILELMLRRSATFRRQCLRIASQPHLVVGLRPAVVEWRPRVRAQTRFFRTPAGNLVAAIEILPLTDTVELIAHEIEHVIEQIDGIDLASRSLLPDTGVRVAAGHPNAFETTRAVRAGLSVSRETQQ
jgi:hypothetical protein